MRVSRYPPTGAERGFSLVELLVSTVLLGVVLAMAYGMLNAGTNTIQVIADEATNATNARLTLTELEANLRYANGFWITGSGPLTGSILTVSNSPLTAFGNQPACAQWTVATLGLYEATDSTGAGFGTASVNTATSPAPGLMMPGVSAFTVTTFAAPLSGLTRIDLTVNQDPRKPGDAVSVHDLISPDNIATSLGVKTACV